MADIEKIISAIDDFLTRKHQKTTTPVEVNPILEGMELLNDSDSRPGKPLREILRKGKIPHAYQIGVNWYIPHSGNKVKAATPPIQKPTPSIEPKSISKGFVQKEPSGHKLEAIANLILELIEKKHHIKPDCFFEYKPDWLFSFPRPQLIADYPKLATLYARLVDDKFSLTTKLGELTARNMGQKQSFDIWIGEPFNFAVEFDEKQHFNQFRKITLDYYDNVQINYPLDLYKKLNKDAFVKPGTSGFTRLKSIDPLFPFLLEGEKQDNRIRQRAFKDYLKDVLPLFNGKNPTLRIPFHITNGKISDFTREDLKRVEEYIESYKLI